MLTSIQRQNGECDLCHVARLSMPVWVHTEGCEKQKTNNHSLQQWAEKHAWKCHILRWMSYKSRKSHGVRLLSAKKTSQLHVFINIHGYLSCNCRNNNVFELRNEWTCCSRTYCRKIFWLIRIENCDWLRIPFLNNTTVMIQINLAFVLFCFPGRCLSLGLAEQRSRRRLHAKKDRAVNWAQLWQCSLMVKHIYATMLSGVSYCIRPSQSAEKRTKEKTIHSLPSGMFSAVNLSGLELSRKVHRSF